MTDILQKVRNELTARAGQLRQIAKDAGVSYDTLLRIRDGDTDPGYSKVVAVHRVLFQRDGIPRGTGRKQRATA